MTETIAAVIVVKAVLSQIVKITHVQIGKTVLISTVKAVLAQIVKIAHAPIAKGALDQTATNALVPSIDAIKKSV